MSLREYVNDITEAFVTIAKGMRITWGYGVSTKEETTIYYPEERMVMPERSRGFLFNDIAKCIVCNMCVKQCPIDCITLSSIKGADKKNVLTSYVINMGRCMHCGLCVEICPPKSLVHTDGYEGSSHTREELIVEFVDEDLSSIKARIARHAAELAKAAKEAEAAGKPPAAPANPAEGEMKK
jgi:NADH-quinone oxidoreductase subunit I